MDLFDNWCCLFWCDDTAWKFHDLDVTKVDLGTFGFEAEVAFFLSGFADAVHKFSINGELDDAIDADEIVDIPFAAGFAAVFN